MLYLQKATEDDQREILVHIRRDDFDEQSADWVIARLCESSAVNAAQQTAQQLIDEAMESLHEIEGDADAKQSLAELARFVVSRKK
jgi:geranylgeranyl pyrophosphate synthase